MICTKCFQRDPEAFIVSAVVKGGTIVECFRCGHTFLEEADHYSKPYWQEYAKRIRKPDEPNPFVQRDADVLSMPAPFSMLNHGENMDSGLIGHAVGQ